MFVEVSVVEERIKRIMFQLAPMQQLHTALKRSNSGSRTDASEGGLGARAKWSIEEKEPWRK